MSERVPQRGWIPREGLSALHHLLSGRNCAGGRSVMSQAEPIIFCDPLEIADMKTPATIGAKSKPDKGTVFNLLELVAQVA